MLIPKKNNDATVKMPIGWPEGAGDSIGRILDEANFYAATQEVRYTHDQVFESLRETLLSTRPATR